MTLSNVTVGTAVTIQNAGGIASFATGTISPPSDCFLFLAGVVDGDVGMTITTSTTLSNVGAWTISQPVHTSPDIGTYTWFAYAKVTGAPGSGTITASFNAAGADAVTMMPGWLTGHDTTTPVPQAIATATNTTSTASVTLGSTPTSTSEVIGIIGRFTSVNAAGTITPGTGFTEAGQQFIWNASYGFGIEVEVQYQNAGSPPANVTATALGTLDTWAAIAVEVAVAAVGGATATPAPHIHSQAVTRASRW